MNITATHKGKNAESMLMDAHIVQSFTGSWHLYISSESNAPLLACLRRDIVVGGVSYRNVLELYRGYQLTARLTCNHRAIAMLVNFNSELGRKQRRAA